MSRYYDKDGSPLTLMEWAKKFEDPTYKRVDLTEFGDKFNTRVSTVWLGADHRFGGEEGPIIFETMVFSDLGSIDQDMKRYTTLKEAQAGHKKMCEHVKKVLSSNEE